MTAAFAAQNSLLPSRPMVPGLASAGVCTLMVMALLSLSAGGVPIAHPAVSIASFPLEADQAQPKSVPVRAQHAAASKPVSLPPSPAMALPVPVPDPSVKADPKPAAPLLPATASAPSSAPSQSKAATEANPAVAATVPAQAASSSEAATQAANATYKGKVWRHLQRFKGEGLAGSGAAMVSFALEIHGRLTQLSLVQSSGSARFDGEALQMVRRAQPFPPPPPEVQPSFLFEIKGQ